LPNGRKLSIINFQFLNGGDTVLFAFDFFIMIPQSIQRLIDELSRLPGIGPKSAERLTFYLLTKPDAALDAFGSAVLDLKKGLAYCEMCQNIAEDVLCKLCNNNSRDHRQICVVEDPMDVFALEGSGAYKGLYHVLHGALSPVDRVGPDDLKIAELVTRIGGGDTDEVILATNPTMTGEATAMYVTRQIKQVDADLKLTHLAQGLPMGGELEFADSDTLKRAFVGRMEY
jgi:recombination protein RecR